ncbi:hypothetical protein FB451DRAFT_1385724 [Mycena latifolia]|nr:hypothetical protein FB451DRAFT_1385724 [Mycena latifolia]
MSMGNYREAPRPSKFPRKKLGLHNPTVSLPGEFRFTFEDYPENLLGARNTASTSNLVIPFVPHFACRAEQFSRGPDVILELALNSVYTSAGLSWTEGAFFQHLEAIARDVRKVPLAQSIDITAYLFIIPFGVLHLLTVERVYVSLFGLPVAPRLSLCQDDIILNLGCTGIEGRHTLRGLDEAGACTRLCSVFEASPPLLRLIRRLRASLEKDIVEQLSEVEFPNLEALISLPSIRRVGLFFLIFRDLHEVGQLFEGCTPYIETLVLHETRMLPYPVALGRSSLPRVRIPGLQIRSRDLDGIRWEWLLDPLYPFDLTSLHDAAAYTASKEKMRMSLADFPTLTHLTLSGWRSSTDVQAVLASLPATAPLEITLFRPAGFDPAGRERLGRALSSAALPALRRMVVPIYREPRLPGTTKTVARAWDARGLEQFPVRITEQI